MPAIKPAPDPDGEDSRSREEVIRENTDPAIAAVNITQAIRGNPLLDVGDDGSVSLKPLETGGGLQALMLKDEETGDQRPFNIEDPHVAAAVEKALRESGRLRAVAPDGRPVELDELLGGGTAEPDVAEGTEETEQKAAQELLGALQRNPLLEIGEDGAVRVTTDEGDDKPYAQVIVDGPDETTETITLDGIPAAAAVMTAYSEERNPRILIGDEELLIGDLLDEAKQSFDTMFGDDPDEDGDDHFDFAIETMWQDAVSNMQTIEIGDGAVSLHLYNGVACVATPSFRLMSGGERQAALSDLLKKVCALRSVMVDEAHYDMNNRLNLDLITEKPNTRDAERALQESDAVRAWFLEPGSSETMTTMDFAEIPEDVRSILGSDETSLTDIIPEGTQLTEPAVQDTEATEDEHRELFMEPDSEGLKAQMMVTLGQKFESKNFRDFASQTPETLITRLKIALLKAARKLSQYELIHDYVSAHEEAYPPETKELHRIQLRGNCPVAYKVVMEAPSLIGDVAGALMQLKQLSVREVSEELNLDETKDDKSNPVRANAKKLLGIAQEALAESATPLSPDAEAS